MDTLATMVDAALAIEKLRVASEVRQSHLARQEKQDPNTDELHRRLKDLEDFVDGVVAKLIQYHPGYNWFSQVKGIGRENIGKVVGAVRVKQVLDGDHYLPYADTISALWKFAGMSVEDGKAPKREKGQKLHYNSQLRSMCWRLGSSLLRAKGKFYDYYLRTKDTYVQRYQNQGWQIVPATALPVKEGKRSETEGIISEGHIHNMAMRKMIKLFLACLWLTWREAEGLPVTKPYALDKLGHDSYIDPWAMTDR